ncbi:hypothetical protein [Paraburkholderia lycopersici]|uniref:hypothetical protein n=1 Tax=Paraburkholderia lycopersici TaxID=416944 RepID=UPI0011611A63|nr:hypothetical protein [Paraburkholderia lycopersici]
MISAAAATDSIVLSSSASSEIAAAAMFSSRCDGFLVPGTGTIHGYRFSTQASASCSGVTPLPMPLPAMNAVLLSNSFP